MNPLHVFYRILNDAGIEICDHSLCGGAAISPYAEHAQIGDHIEDPRTWFDNEPGYVVIEGEWLVTDRKWAEVNGQSDDDDDTNFQLTIYLKKP